MTTPPASIAPALPAALVVAAAYLLGSVPTGLWLGRLWKGVDVRRHGSGNLGATNVFRVLGPAAGAVTLAVDIVKGILPVVAARTLFPETAWMPVAAGLAAILGHTASLFVGFRGGKGVATSAGVFLALMPIPAAFAVLLFGILLSATRIVSISSVLAGLGMALAAQLLESAAALRAAAAVVACFIIWTHRANLRRLLAGTEPRIHLSRKT